jgi:hypothetical protein
MGSEVLIMTRNIVPAVTARRLISSRMTFLHKRLFPAVWFGGMAVFVLVGLRAQVGPRSPGPIVLIVPIIMATFAFLLMKRLVFDLADEVWDLGSALLIKNKGHEVRVELPEIINISHSRFTNPHRATLSLRRSTPLGNEISFMPPAQLLPFVRSPVVDELIQRVDDARLRALR